MKVKSKVPKHLFLVSLDNLLDFFSSLKMLTLQTFRSNITSGGESSTPAL